MNEKADPTAQVLLLPLQTTTGTGSALGSAARPYRPSSDVHPVLRRAGAPPAALDLLAQAHRGLAEARGLEGPLERYATAHLAALRGAAAGLAEARELEGPLERYATAHLAALRGSAAVLAVRGRPEENPRRRKRIRSAWEVLPEVAPELAEWSVYYAAGAAKRASAEAGITSAATMREADDLIRNTALFLRIVQRLLALEPTGPADSGRMPRTG